MTTTPICKKRLTRLPKVLEDKITDLYSDLEAVDTHRRLTQLLVLELNKNVHKYGRLECWCTKRGKIGICKCIKGLIKPQRLTKSYLYTGFGFKDLIREWTYNIHRGLYCLRCTACTSGCSCQTFFTERLRYDQIITGDSCDREFLHHVTRGRKICDTKTKEPSLYCKCNGTTKMLVKTADH